MSPRGGTVSGVAVRLIGPPEMDGEYVGLRRRDAAEEEIVHLHDYDRIYSTPGLYEGIVQGLLRCTSPQVVAEGLVRALESRGADPAELALLDLGSGTGLVAEQVASHGITNVIGVDSLASARAACLRDRPGLYRKYLVADLAHPSERVLSELGALRPSALTAAGAFGGAHASAGVLCAALGLLPSGAPIAFTIDERWTSDDNRGATTFKAPLAELIASGTLTLLERSRFKHRISTTGEPICYELFVALKG